LMAVTKGARGKRKHAKPNGKRRKAAAHKRKQGATDEEAMKEIQTMLTNFDADGSGKLDVVELKQLLTSLNEGGDPPSDDEVADVMKAVDKDGSGDLNKEELALGVADWYSAYADDEEAEAEDADDLPPAAAAPVGSAPQAEDSSTQAPASSCCSIA